jgi:hypothetical protein
LGRLRRKRTATQIRTAARHSLGNVEHGSRRSSVVGLDGGDSQQL